MATPAQTLITNSACFACEGMTAFEAMQLALWDTISQSINPSPPGATNYILWDVGSNVLTSQVGDRLIWQ